MILGVAYDIKDDNNRERVANWLLRKGVRVQKSFYIINSEETDILSIAREISKLITNEDSLAIFPLCERCLKKSVLYNPSIDLVDRVF
jgi:CRISPR-associated protein Cas2